MCRRNLYTSAGCTSCTMLIAVAQHDQSGNAEIGMVQVALIHRTITHASSRVLTMHNEIHQSFLIDADMLYS